MTNYLSILFLILSCIATVASAQEMPYVPHFPESKELLKSLKPGHPRLFITHDKIQAIKSQAEHNDFIKRAVDALIARAESFIDQPTVEYKIIGPRLLAQSRRCFERVSILSFAYFLTDNRKYIHRTEHELLAAAKFPDWNPSHFLDVAEMTHAFGIGYDWLYNVLSDSSKLKIRKALIEKGLNAGLKGYKEQVWWAQCIHNWNQVCNGGLTVGALAIADEYPELAGNILSQAIKNVTFALASYAPGGGWGEGPGYWSYATHYTVYLLAALESALSTDFGLSNAPGFSQTGLFPIYNTGPFELSFNYADAHEGTHPMFPFYWLSHKFKLPICAEEQTRRLDKALAAGKSPTPWDLLYYQHVPKQKMLPLNTYYKGIEAVFLRSDWQDEDAFFIGFKGGDNRTNHAHLDLGSFVFDALGQRWASDLGSDYYNLPDYWDRKEGGKRWKYFRLNNYSHNTLILNNDLQRVAAKAPFVKTQLNGINPYGIVDLSEAYFPHTKQVLRGISLVRKNSILIQDEIVWKASQKNWMWNFMTRAHIKLAGKIANLTLNNKTVVFTLLSPKSAVFDTASAYRLPPEDPNAGFGRLIVQGSETGSSTRIAVIISEQKKDMQLKSLEKW